MAPSHHELTLDWLSLVRSHPRPELLALGAHDVIALHNAAYAPFAKPDLTDDQVVDMNTELQELGQQKIRAVKEVEEGRWSRGKGEREMRVLVWREEVLVALLGERKEQG